MSAILYHALQTLLLLSVFLALAIYPATLIVCLGRRFLRPVPLTAISVPISLLLVAIGSHLL